MKEKFRNDIEITNFISDESWVTMSDTMEKSGEIIIKCLSENYSGFIFNKPELEFWCGLLILYDLVQIP